MTDKAMCCSNDGNSEQRNAFLECVFSSLLHTRCDCNGYILIGSHALSASYAAFEYIL